MENSGNAREAGRPVVRYLDETETVACPYGNVRRVVTGGEGGVANVHVVTVTEGKPHLHNGYDEIYFVLRGTGHIIIGGERSELRPGAVAVIPAGVAHELYSHTDEPLEFVIFGNPPMPIDDPRARPEAAPGCVPHGRER